ncbi:MAG: DUF3810 domain-containing protein [Bacteroidia bacterium]
MQFPRKLLLTSSVLFLSSALVFFWGLNAELVLNYYSNGIYPIIAVCLRWLSSLSSYALGDILYAFLIILALRHIFLLIKNRKSLTRVEWLQVPFKIVNVFLILYISFKLLWGLNYARPSISTQLAITDEKYGTKELLLLTDFFIAQTNALHIKVNPKKTYSLNEIKHQSVLAYQKMEMSNPFYKYTRASFKPVTSGWATSKIGIEGYYNPLSGEANLNFLLPQWVLPFVACHEIAHQIGVAREDEANLVGYLTAVNSDDVSFRYSANYNMLRYLLFEVRIKSPENYALLYQKILPGVIANFKAERDFWQKYNSDMSGYMNIAFDKFLKLNNQQNGIKSYQNIVIWLWNLHKAELIGERTSRE